MRSSGVYAIVNTLDDRRYVGSSVSLCNRWSKHRMDLQHGVHHSVALQRAWNTHGPSVFMFVVLDLVEDFTERLRVEQARLDETPEPYNTMNVAYVRCVPGTVRSPGTRRRLSDALKGRKKSPEHRAALSAAMKGRKNPKHAEAIRGRKASAETREKMRAAHTGLRQTPETCAKRGAKLKGRIFTPEWKAKISAAKRGKPWSERRLNAHRESQAGLPAPAVSMSDAPVMAPHDHVTH